MSDVFGDIYDCGHEGAEIVFDPYLEEIHGQQVEVRLCGDCYQALVDET